MSKHKATAAEKRDMAALATIYVVAGLVVAAFFAFLGFLALSPLVWALWEVSTNPHPNAGAMSIIILWTLGIITVAILIVRGSLKPRSKPQTRAWPPKAVWPESEFQNEGNLGKWAGDEK